MKMKKIKSISLTAVVLFFSYQMATLIFPYTSGRLDIDFLVTKQHIIYLDYYKWAFWIHIFSSLPVLLSGAILFSKYFQKKYTTIHRNIGKLYVALVLFLSAPSGMILAFHANGGFWAQLSFAIATILWWRFTYLGLTTARNRNFTAHRIWMIRSYAIAFSAVTLRLSQMFLSQVDLIPFEYQYIFVAWESWLLNLAIAEMILWRKNIRFLLKNGFVFRQTVTG